WFLTVQKRLLFPANSRQTFDQQRLGAPYARCRIRCSSPPFPEVAAPAGSRQLITLSVIVSWTRNTFRSRGQRMLPIRSLGHRMAPERTRKAHPSSPAGPLDAGMRPIHGSNGGRRIGETDSRSHLCLPTQFLQDAPLDRSQVGFVGIGILGTAD